MWTLMLVLNILNILQIQVLLSTIIVTFRPWQRLSINAQIRPTKQVYLYSNNWRTTSFFALNNMQIYGNGSIRCVVMNDSNYFTLGENLSSQYSSYIDLINAYHNSSSGKSEFRSQFDCVTAMEKGVFFSSALLGDEFCDCSREICNSTKNSIGVFARAYFSSAYMPNFEFGLTNSDSIAYLPLGPRLDFGLISNPASTKIWLFNLIISPTSESRSNLLTIINSTTFSKSLKFGQKYFLNVAEKWTGDFNGKKFGRLNSSEYKEVLLSSIFTLCPLGRNPETFRIFEAIEAGSIPVLSLDQVSPCHD